jgi:hypothetical protein
MREMRVYFRDVVLWDSRLRLQTRSEIKIVSNFHRNFIIILRTVDFFGPFPFPWLRIPFFLSFFLSFELHWKLQRIEPDAFSHSSLRQIVVPTIIEVFSRPLWAVVNRGTSWIWKVFFSFRTLKLIVALWTVETLGASRFLGCNMLSTFDVWLTVRPSKERLTFRMKPIMEWHQRLLSTFVWQKAIRRSSFLSIFNVISGWCDYD